MPRSPRLPALAALACALVPLAGAAAADAVPDIDEAHAILEESCTSTGASEGECACLDAFVEEHFSDREVIGAAIVFADPTMAEDPAIALAALSDAGYSPDEITAVLARIVALDTMAQDACPAEAAAASGD